MTLTIFHLETEILKEHSRKQCDHIVAWIGTDAKRFKQVLELVLAGEKLVQQRGCWPLSHAAIANPEFLHHCLEPLLENLRKPGLHNGIKRNTMRILENIEIPTKLEGDVMNVCFGFLENPAEAIAVKACSLTVLGNLARNYPEIIPEITLLIEDQSHQTPALKSRAGKLLKSFTKSKRSLLQNTHR